MAEKILVVDDDLSVCRSLQEVFHANGFLASYAINPSHTLELLKTERFDLAIIDVRMPQIDGIDLLRLIKRENHDIPIIIISGHGTVDLAVAAMKLGAVNFYTKPINLNNLLSEIRQICALLRNRSVSPGNPQIVTQNSRMRKLLDIVEKVAPTKATVLITGESGTGKELVAEAIHRYSQRSGSPFIRLNCAAIPELLLESELFGHEKGAFTDAKTQRIGKFEQAAGGSIFLDEIGDMTYQTQGKLLRVLQERTLTRLGGSREIGVDCRFIAATNKDLEKLTSQGVFRQDLYYRLSVVTIQLPPLRERRDDILLLADHFLSEFCRLYGKEIAGFSEEVRSFLAAHSWPGNVRELKNFVERTVIFTDSRIVDIRSLPEQYRSISEKHAPQSLKEKQNELTREFILEALQQSKGVKSKAADLLKVDRKTLYNRLRKLNWGR